MARPRREDAGPSTWCAPVPSRMCIVPQLKQGHAQGCAFKLGCEFVRERHDVGCPCACAQLLIKASCSGLGPSKAITHAVVLDDPLSNLCAWHPHQTLPTSKQIMLAP